MIRVALVGTRFGVVAQRLRERYEIFCATGGAMEELSGRANDLLARRILETLCLPSKAFVDVGAHIGSVIDGVARHSRPSCVIAVEAIPAKAEAIQRKFPSVIVHSCAVGEADGRLPFFIDQHQSGYSSLYPREAANLKEIHVPVRQLDDLIGSEKIDVIKIDVEGAELGALRGASKVVARDRPTIMFESGPSEVGGFTKAALWAWLDDAGYAILVPNRVAHNDPGLSLDGFIESHLYPRRTTNYLAVARDRREEIRARARMVLKLPIH